MTKTKKISNFILSEPTERRKWKKPEVGEKFSVMGNCNNESITIEEGTVVSQNELTAKGKIYLLEDLQEDYSDFVGAVTRNIPIIEYWNIKGNKKEGYTISGFVGNTPIKGRIMKKDTNIVTLDDGKEYFVQWRNYSADFNFRMFEVAIAADDIKFPESFDWFGDCKCRPRIIVQGN